MEILGVGVPELIFVIIIALIVLGPKDMQKAGKTIGKWLRSIITSDGWKIFQQTSREIRTLPNKLIRDANEEINKIGNEINPASYLADKGRDAKKPATRSMPFSPTVNQTPQPDNQTESKENESDQTTNA
jgi:Sec-independent protein translocase protein TatA